jgi:hypothetical protein
MKNREVFVRDPAVSKLMNNGQARINDGFTDQERETLREELSNFVCEGQYEDGTTRILESFLRHVDGTQQPAAWVSGFYGSGKSHLLKMLCHLWVDTEFADGVRARSLVPDLSSDVLAALKELDTQGRRLGGLHAISGTLPSGGTDSVKLTVLGLVLRSKGLPENFAQAKFCLYLKNNGFYDQVKSAVEDAGKEFLRELNNLYVSPILHDALVSVDSGYGDRKSARDTLKKEFVQPGDISTSELIEIVREVLSVDDQLPCTIIVLDEVQIYIGDSKDRVKDIVEIAEAFSKQLDSRAIVIGAGQNALAAQAKHFEWLRARFTIPVELSDADVETVTRRVLLQKKPEHVDAIRKMLDLNAGEIERQLSGTRICSNSDDREILVEDYPLLPVRRRFWEAVFRAVDPAGTSGMLRSQLRIIHDALHESAESPLGSVVPADYMFDQLQPNLVQQAVLPGALDVIIRNLDDGTEEGVLKRRLCGLIFLVRKLPREAGFDIGVRATKEMLPDLMVSDLKGDGSKLRRVIPELLDQLVEEGVLLKDEDEYNLQTKEYSNWDNEYRTRLQRLNAQPSEIYTKRDNLVRAAANDAIKSIQLFHGARKEKRRLAIHFGDDQPVVDGDSVPVWIRDENAASEKQVIESARAAGTDSPIVFVSIPKPGGGNNNLDAQIVRYEAAESTIQFKGVVVGEPANEAKRAITSRKEDAKRCRDEIINEMIDGAKVFKGGGSEVLPLTVDEKVKEAASDALDRLFPNFKDADHKNWTVVIGRAKNGDETPLQAVDWNTETKQHPVCKALMREIGAGSDGSSLQKLFRATPYGWPQDTVDGALMALHNSGDVTVRYQGESVPMGKLDQTKIKRADFKLETITLSAKDKIALRGLFQDAGVSAKPSDDLEMKSSEFLQVLGQLGLQSGGDAPLPERPKTTHLDDLRNLAGNERLSAMLTQAADLKQSATEWKSLAELSEKRMPQWETLGRLMKHAEGQEGFDEIKSAVDGIVENRLLLDGTDHVTPLVKKAAGALRNAVNDSHDGFKNAYDNCHSSLATSDSWQKIDADKQTEILASEGISQIPTIAVGSDEELLRTLDQTPLSSWKDKADALTSRFSSATTTAAKLIEPKLQRVHLTSGTLKTEAEIKSWLVEQETKLIEKLGDGPIVIS